MISETETIFYGNLEIRMLTTGWRNGFMAKATSELSLKGYAEEKEEKEASIECVLMKNHNLLIAYQVLGTVVGIICISTHLLLTKTLGDGYHYYPPFYGVRGSSIKR